MGFEYSAEITNAPSDLVFQLRQALAREGDWLVMVDSDSEASSIALKYAENVRREGWPEDFQVNISPTQIYVLFHTGTQSTQERFLHFLTVQLNAAGVETSFQDL